MLHPFVAELINLFLHHAHQETADWQRAYMKHKFDFFGIKQPVRTALQKSVYRQIPISSMDELHTIVMQLWTHEKRECQYAATDVMILYKKLWTPSTLSLFLACIEQKAWWDTIDDLASNCVGTLCALHPHLINTMDRWIDNPNMWLRRSALLFQLRYKDKTDAQRLFAYCSKTMHEKEFFIRKAIGWVLREYSKTNPKAVTLFVSTNRHFLSPLSIREASKYISHE